MFGYVEGDVTKSCTLRITQDPQSDTHLLMGCTSCEHFRRRFSTDPQVRDLLTPCGEKVQVDSASVTVTFK
jgi:hypothetical protein